MLESLEFDSRDGLQPEFGVVFHALESLRVSILVGDQDMEYMLVMGIEIGVKFESFSV